jgi:hypothetical protein
VIVKAHYNHKHTSVGIICIKRLFNDTLSTSIFYTAGKKVWYVNDQMQKVWREECVTVCCVTVATQREENHEDLSNDRSTWLEFDLSIF